MRSGSGWVRDAGLVLLALVVLAGSVLVLRGYTLSGAPQPIQAQELPALRVLAVVDDLVGDTPEAPAAVEQAGDALSWDLTVLPARGIGFTAAPAGETNLPGLVERAFPEGPFDAVLVQAGGPDEAASPGEVGAGALGTIRRLRDRVPLSTRIVLVGPVRPAGQVEQVSAVLEAVATRERVFFLDPVAGAWLPDAAALREPAAQRALGRRLADELRQLGLTG